MASQGFSYSINQYSAVSVYMQIENQVQFAIASGKLQAGDSLPSVREMSKMLAINPNTVTKAYRDLELLNLVQPRRGVGVTVCEKAPRLCRDKANAIVRDHLKEAVAESIACGLNGSEIRRIVSEAIEAGPAPHGSGPSQI